MTEGNTTHIYEYDSLDRLIRAWQKDSNGNNVVAVENTYDSLGRAKGSTYVVNGKEMSYDITYKADSSLVASVGMPDADILMSAINYTYDNFERLTTKDISLSNMTDIYEDYTYYTYTDTDDKTHTTSLVSSVTLRISSGGTTTSTVYSYTYDNLGNISSVSKNGVLVESYEYDSLGQLIRENNATENYTKVYQYDKAGNIEVTAIYDYTTDITANLPIAGGRDITPYYYSTTAWGDMLTQYGIESSTISYDAIGNPTNWRNATNLTWKARELQSLTVTSGPPVAYEYNSAGIRTKKTLGNVITYDYVLDGTSIVSETMTDVSGNTSYTLYYLYDESGEVQGFIYNNAYYYYQKNLQRDVVRIVNSAGTVVVEYTYDAWGNVLSVTGSLASTIGQYNPFRYRGYYYDSETGFYYLQSRYYDPVVGRFLNADGIVGANGGILGNHLFAYCNNNPIMHRDGLGYSAGDVAEATVGIVGLFLSILDIATPFVEIALISISVGFLAYSVSEMTTTYPGINILDVLTSSSTKEKDLVITQDAVAEEAEKEKAKEKITPYQTADLINGQVVIGEYISMKAAYARMVAGLNVMCASSQAAYDLVWIYGPDALIYEIDKNKQYTFGYYYHFHIRTMPGIHVWHKGPGNEVYKEKFSRN